ncbi:putative Protein SMG9 [Hypsibius exemplaris]|uniref:Protein SMG9 n=1 Tax=Hypsibius exemplaris TaxID=2072580 RepID=A0A9X6NHX9_HYPEX|nr:putative Protein SMG9 [Hypsibius exemplaris]
MENSDPNLPRGMLRIAKRGDTLEPRSSVTSSAAMSESTYATGRVLERVAEQEPRSRSNPRDDSDPPRRGVLRINPLEFPTPGVSPALRYSRPPAPMGGGYPAMRGGRGGGAPPLGSPRPRPILSATIRSPIPVRSEVGTSLRMEFEKPVRIATNMARPAGPAMAVKGTLTPEGKSSGPVFASDFATQEIFRALEQAKPTSIPKPPIPELTDEQKADPAILREFYLTQLRMLVKDSQLLREFIMTKPVKLIDSYFFWCLRKGPPLEQLIQAVNPKNQNFQVVGVIGLQETGKSYILSQMIGQKDVGPIFGPLTTLLDPIKPYGKFRTEGVDCYISREQRTIFLDVQPIYSGSVLEEMIIGDRKPPVISSEHVFVEHTVELQSIMFGAFLMSVCHKLLIVMKGGVDERVLRFLRLATILKLGPVHKDALNEANLFDHWPDLVFVNNMCNPQDLYWERQHLARGKLAILMKDYPMRYNSEPDKKSANALKSEEEIERTAGDAIKLFLIPDAESLANDEYLKAEFRNQLSRLKGVVVGGLPKESVTPGMPMTEKEWFKYARRCWAAVCKAPLVNSIAKELNVSNSV